jgi:hypothetical protein
MFLRVASVSYKRFSAIFPLGLCTLKIKCGKPIIHKYLLSKATVDVKKQ